MPTADRPKLESSAGIRWVMGLVEPLLPTGRRKELDAELRRDCKTRPDWAAIWFGGVIADLMLTLPAADPWRHLSARAPRHADADLVRGDLPPASGFGAFTAKGQPFGTWADATDLIDQAFDDIQIDVGLTALAEPLSLPAATLLAFGADRWERCAQAAQAVHDQHAGPMDAPRGTLEVAYDDEQLPYLNKGPAGYASYALFEAGSTAIRWALHRRRSYGITDDPWPIESAWNWAWRANRVQSGRDWAVEDIELALAAERIREQSVDNLR